MKVELTNTSPAPRNAISPEPPPMYNGSIARPKTMRVVPTKVVR